METWQKMLQASITSPSRLTRRYGIDPRPLAEVTERYPMRVPPIT
jgi:lysine 2,3-aminomutase